MSATNRGSIRETNDFYATPRKVIKHFFDNYNVLSEVENVFEPSAGNGNFIQELRERERERVHITSVEIRSEEKEFLELISDHVVIEDFLKWTTAEKFDLIIGNPPYKYAQEFLEKCFKLSHKKTKIIMLLRTSFLESKKRHSFWKQHSLNGLYTLSERLSFTGKGTDASSYSWFIWGGSANQEIKVI